MSVKFMPGDRVLIEKNPRDQSWVQAMDKYSGMTAIVEQEDAIHKNHYRLNIDEFTYNRWLWNGLSLKLAVFNKDQHCIVCNQECPHSEPNTINGKYICVVCSTIEMLSLQEEP
jgi:hypothetical protein